jgi:hypothetical protein
MAYPKYAEGNKPYTAASGNAVLSADVNEANTQLAGMLGPLNVTASIASASWYRYATATLDAQRWDFRADLITSPPQYWERLGSHANPLVLPLGTLRKGQKITACSVVIYGDATGGEIKLYKNLISSAAAAAASVGTAGTDPWNQLAAWAELPINGMPETVVDKTSYWLRFVTPTTGTMRVLGAWYTVQFGN